MPRKKTVKQEGREFHRVTVQEIIDFAGMMNLDPRIVGISFWTDKAISEVQEMKENDYEQFTNLVQFYQPYIPLQMPVLPKPKEGWFKEFLKHNDIASLGLPIFTEFIE